MIEEKFMRELYMRTARQYGRKEANEDEFRAWKDVLSPYRYSDVDAAVRRWPQNTTTEEFTGRPIGSRMPTATEIKVSIQVFECSTAQRFNPCDGEYCHSGWNYVSGGTMLRRDQPIPVGTRVKRCQCWLSWAEMRKTA